MLVKKIVVAATRKVPHPVAEFASLSALVSLEAEVSGDEDFIHCVQILQANVEESVDAHLRKLSANISARHRKDLDAQRAKSGTENKIDSLIAKHGGAF